MEDRRIRERMEQISPQGDSTTRSIAIITGTENYVKIWYRITELKKERGLGDADHEGTPREVYDRVAREYGLSKIWEWEKDLGTQIDLREVPLITGGRDCAVTLIRHMTAIKDGTIRDIFDPSKLWIADNVLEIYVRKEEEKEAARSCKEYLKTR